MKIVLDCVVYGIAAGFPVLFLYGMFKWAQEVSRD